MRMPVTQFGTVRLPLPPLPTFLPSLNPSSVLQMEFKRFTEILAVGEEFAVDLLAEWAGKGMLPTGLEGDVSTQKKQKRGQSIRRNSI
jgi:hypothetical protein